MRAARIVFSKERLLQLLHLPLSLSLRALPEPESSLPRSVQFLLEGEALPDSFELLEGERIPQARLEYRTVHAPDGTVRNVELVTIRKVDP